jgi:hypothetical protein
MSSVKVVCKESGPLSIAVLFAAALDNRITSADIDMQNHCYQKRHLPVNSPPGAPLDLIVHRYSIDEEELPIVPFVLQHGDVLQWATLMADRDLTIRNLPPEAGDPDWLSSVFDAMDNLKGIKIISN